jgi:hypothetical protein
MRLREAFRDQEEVLHGGWWRWDASAGIVGSDRLELMLTLIWRGIKAFVQLHHFRPLELELDGFPSSLVSARRNPAKRRANALIVHFPQLRARLLRPPPRELGARPTPSATCISRTRDEVPNGPFPFWFQRGLVRPSDVWRLAAWPNSVSERPTSLSIRPSPRSRRLIKVLEFQHVVEIEMRRS